MTKAREGCAARALTTCCVFSLLGLKYLPQLANPTICFADVLVNFSCYYVFSPYPPGEKLRRAYDEYTFTRSLLDVVCVAGFRGLSILVAYLVCNCIAFRNSRRKYTSLQGSSRRGSRTKQYQSYMVCSKLLTGSSSEFYLMTVVVSCLSLAFLAAKASLYDYTIDSKIYVNFPAFGPAMLFMNVCFTFVHVAAAKTFDFLTKRRQRLRLNVGRGFMFRTYESDDAAHPLLATTGGCSSLGGSSYGSLGGSGGDGFDALYDRDGNSSLMQSLLDRPIQQPSMDGGARVHGNSSSSSHGWRSKKGWFHWLSWSHRGNTTTNTSHGNEFDVEGHPSSSLLVGKQQQSTFGGGFGFRLEGEERYATQQQYHHHHGSHDSHSHSHGGHSRTPSRTNNAMPGGGGVPSPRSHSRSSSRSSLSSSLYREPSMHMDVLDLSEPNSQFVTLTDNLVVHYQEFKTNTNKEAAKEVVGVAEQNETETSEEGEGDDLSPRAKEADSGDESDNIDSSNEGTTGGVKEDETQQQQKEKQEEEAVLVMPGFYGNVSCWKSVAIDLGEKLSDEAEREANTTSTSSSSKIKRVIVIDRIGFGLSSRPAMWSTGEGEASLYSCKSHAEVVLGLCQKLGLKRVSLVAHDDAAMIVLLFARRVQEIASDTKRSPLVYKYQDLPVISKVCLLHPNLGGDVVSKLMEHLLSSNIKTQARKHLVRMEVEVALRRQCYRSSSITSDRMEHYIKPLHVENWERALRFSVQAMKQNVEENIESSNTHNSASTSSSSKKEKGKDSNNNHPFVENNHLIGALASCRARVLVATGAHDSVVRPDNLKPFLSSLKEMQKKQLQLDSTSGEINTSPGPGSSDQYIFDDCGHLSHEECADELVNVLAHFLSSSP